MAVTTMQNSEGPEQNDLQLWTGVLAGPIAWILDEGLSYALTQHACSTGHVYVLHVISVVSLIIAIIGAWIAWRQWSLLGEGSDEGGSAHDRAWWMARVGVALGIGFGIVIVALAVPKFMLSPCS